MKDDTISRVPQSLLYSFVVGSVIFYSAVCLEAVCLNGLHSWLGVGLS